ncbi:hypothetical protein PR202_gb21553 [Eleusine coracana subsp. coracana]|uniref:Uncharacterized protein n=1 Tax=Eleusine coracana subsp. coracana TaxID=191504 RepID=A0AAV5FFH4_ELECO|nr:hypothetical protein PR202_gb21553 [Eleusine coracana subsp. coracana]
MAGDKGKGKRTSLPAEQCGGEERGDKGKGKQTSLPAEQRGGEERGPKIRKVTQEEMGKRKGKLQIKERDKPMELEKARKLEEKSRKAPTWGKGEKVAAEKWADFAKQATKKKVDYYKTIVEQDCEHLFLTEEMMADWPTGPDAARALMARAREEVKGFKDFAADQIKQYEEKGYYLEGYPECRIDPALLKLLKAGN